MIKIADGHVYPNTTFEARWRITESNGTQELGPSVSLTYADTRFDWKTKTGPIVRVHWYEGDDAFGARALAIGEKGIANAAALLGVTETEPVDFFIYDSTVPFYDALGPGTRENVGGLANAQIRTLFALITPDEINASWVGTVIPHELTHLVFNTATENPYHSPPRWLNEGLAVYLSEGYTAAWRSTVAAAVASGGIIPLNGLTGQFPTTADQFSLAYGESVAAVDFMIRTYGQPALVKLVRSYADGVSDDEAFTGSAGRGHERFRKRLAQGAGRSDAERLRPAVTPARAAPVRLAGSCRRALDRPRRERRGVAGRDGEPGTVDRGHPGGLNRRGRQFGGPAGTGRGRRGRRRDRPPLLAVASPPAVWPTSVAAPTSGRPVTARSTPGNGSRLRRVPTWQIALGLALLVLGFLVVAQYQSNGPRVQYATDERGPLVETAIGLQDPSRTA